MFFIWTKWPDTTQMLLITGDAAEGKKNMLQKSSKEHKKTEDKHLVPRLLKNYIIERIG